MRSGWKLPAASRPTSSEFSRNVWQARRNNSHSSNGVVKQTCRHTKCHQSKGWKGNEEVRAIGTTIRTTTDTPCRFQRGTQITIIQNGVAYTFQLNEWNEQAYAHIIHERYYVYVGRLGECLHFFVENGVVRHDIPLT